MNSRPNNSNYITKPYTSTCTVLLSPIEKQRALSFSLGIFNLYMGWFSGYAEDLMPLPRNTKASKYIELMGGAEKVLEASASSMAKGEAEYKVGGR